MTEILQFFDQHYILAFFAILFTFGLLNMPFRIVNRICRSRNIVAHGWPPEHCDADGDHKIRAD